MDVINAHVLMPYVNGDMPHQGRVPWHEASVVYAIANIDNNHWVTVQISFEHQRFVIYNSISSSINWKNIHEGFITVAKFVPWLCKEKGVWDRRNTFVELKSEWEIVPYPNPPQQNNGSDCGIMALKYIECLVSGHDVVDLDPKRCAIFRRSYCGQLYEYGQKFPDSPSS